MAPRARTAAVVSPRTVRTPLSQPDAMASVGTTVSLTLARSGNVEPLHVDIIREKIRT